MKTIKKSTLLKLKADTIKFRKTGNMSYLDERIVIARQLSTQAYGTDSSWLAFVDFIDGLVGAYGLYPDCTGEELCELFRAFKFEVVNDG